MSNEKHSPRRGEVWQVDFNPTKGSEIKKLRPAIVVTGNRQSQQNMQRIYKRDAPELFLGKPASNVFLMKNNGLALKYAWTVRERSPFYVDVYLADELHPHQIPDKVRRAADWKKEQGFGRYPASEETLTKEGLPSQQELEKIELDFSMKLPQKASRF